MCRKRAPVCVSCDALLETRLHHQRFPWRWAETSLQSRDEGTQETGSRPSASVLCRSGPQAGPPLCLCSGRSCSSHFGTFPQCLVLPCIVVFSSGREVTNISLSSQQTNSMHKATRQLLGTRWRTRLPSPARRVGVEVVHDSHHRPFSSEQWAVPAGLPDGGFF